MNATDVVNQLKLAEEQLAYWKEQDHIARRACEHKWADGTSALGRSDGMGACERLCNACDRWIEV